nr:glycosyltransferase [Sansalvadorimonas sp. 2012CJ34-2]
MPEQDTSEVHQNQKRVLQLCHGYGMPFHDVARQYAALFKDTEFKVTTVFLTGPKDEFIANTVDSDEVIFLENTSKDIRGLKLKQIKQIRELCQKHHYSFCIAHRFKPIYIATHVKGLFVIGIHHAFGDYSRWTRRLYANRIQKNLALIGVSNSVRDDMRASLPSFPKEKIATLYNRIDIDQHAASLLAKTEAREALDLPKDKYIFANVGRLHPDKDQSTLLKAFAAIKPYQTNSVLVIMGKGKLEQTLKEEANALGIKKQVIFTGPIPEASKYFKAFDSFVLSSDHEPFGMVLLEAMIAGLPMAVCNSGGAPEVAGVCGESFSLGDAEALANRMNLLMKLTETEKENIKQSMMIRLYSHFSDTAVKAAFWNLPFLPDLENINI